MCHAVPERHDRTLELWAGFECTLNRVGARQHDQLARSGHYDRRDDIHRVAALGVRTIRYPVLWERVEGEGGTERAWASSDAALASIQALGMEPIVGLMHHGSGPLDTSLLDEGFPERFAAYAGAVAARYPWVTRFTPINEPLTTARFSALYGLWYPHARSDGAFVRAVLNQTRATRLAMAAIRRVTPAALLVQTEDLGRVHSTPALADQADFENDRRWLSIDLLVGRVNAGHALWDFMQHAGVSARDLARAVGDGCPPDLFGVNHYITGERWLDERLERYPARTHGGNGRIRYADVEAVRAHPEGVSGPAALLVEAWTRYGIPMAVTEAHLGCTREQQLRWLQEVWNGALAARAAGADLRAVTAWAVLGAHDWASLVTRESGEYEPGLFDTRSPAPRPTALAAMASGLARDGHWSHPALHGSGWWHRPERLMHPSRDTGGRSIAEHRARPVLVAGALGTLGSAFVRHCNARGLACRAVSHHDLDVRDHSAVSAMIAETGAWAMVNAAGYVRVDDAEADAIACDDANVRGAASSAGACAAAGVAYAAFSSDLVFDGRRGIPYVEQDAPAPLGVYGRSKAEAERRVLAAAPRAMVVRTAWFFGPWDDANFLTAALHRIACGIPVMQADDLIVSPTYVPHLVDVTLDLLIDGERGVWHLANRGSGSVADVVRRAAVLAGLDASLVRGCPAAELGLAAARPPYAVLGSSRSTIMPTLEHALGEYVSARPWERLGDSARAPLVAMEVPSRRPLR